MSGDLEDLDDLTPEERRLLRSRWARDAAGETAKLGGSLVGCALEIGIGFGVIVLVVWAALQVLQ